MGRGKVDFDRGIARLASYARAYGHANPKVDEVWLEWTVGLWLSNLRKKYRDGKLTKPQIHAAQAIGVKLSPPYREPKPAPPTRAESTEHKMLQRLAQLEPFFRSKHHINVRQLHGTPDWPGAGHWVARLRGLYRNRKLPQSVIERAEQLNINWDPGRRTRKR